MNYKMPHQNMQFFPHSIAVYKNSDAIQVKQRKKYAATFSCVSNKFRQKRCYQFTHTTTRAPNHRKLASI